VTMATLAATSILVTASTAAAVIRAMPGSYIKLSLS
jgi:hypothetical protein